TAAPQLRGTTDNDAMSIREEHVCAHTAHLFECEETQLVHPVVNERSPFSLRGEHCHKADQIAWKSWPQTRRYAPHRFGRRGFYLEDTVAHAAFDLHASENGCHDFDVFLARAFDIDFAAVDS